MIRDIFKKEMNRESIFKDRNLILPHYIPDELPFREKQIGEISTILARTLTGKKPDNIFTYGKTGTGKTSTAKQVVKELLAFAKDQSNNSIEAIYINCKTFNSKYRIVLKCNGKFYKNENMIGYSASYVYEKFINYISDNSKHVIIILDELDMVKDLNDLIYALTRGNDELKGGSISIVGITNNVSFKEKLDPRTKSNLLEHEMVFPPYNAEELKEILKQRVSIAFNEDTVDDSAINLAAALAAQESGDARKAVMLMSKAGEIADQEQKTKVTDDEVMKASKKVEADIIINLISTLPEQQQLVLLAIAELSTMKTSTVKITGEVEEGTLFSGDIYEKYQTIAKTLDKRVVSARWYREYIRELEMYGLIITTSSGAGIRGSTTLIKLQYSPANIQETIKAELSK